MLDGLRMRIADGLTALAQRVGSDPRYPDEQRVHRRVMTVAGTRITADNVATIATVWACLRYISQTVAGFPWHVMRSVAQGSEIARTHPVDWLIWRRVSPEWSSFQFRETLAHWALRYGNGYAEIEPDEAGRPLALHPVHPDRVKVCRAIEAAIIAYGDEIAEGELYYEVGQGTAERVSIAAKRMFHVRGFGDGPVGVNVVDYAAESLGWAQAVQLFGAAFFGNGMTPSGVIINKKPLSPKGKELQREELEQLYRGPRRAGRTAIIDADAEWKALTINARDAQLIDVHQHLVEEICRWFGVPPHKVAHLLRATFSNIEHQSIEVVVDSISPWVKRFEDEADYKLFGIQNRQGFYTKMNMRSLMRGDTAARGQYYQMMRQIGAYNVNRILELEDENTIGPEGEKRVMQSQYTTLERIGEEPVEAAAPAGPPANDNEDEDRAAARLDEIARVLGASEPVHAE